MVKRGWRLDRMRSDERFGSTVRSTATLLPDPPPRERRFTIISADDHYVEPPDLFTARVPRRFEDAVPRVVEDADGGLHWRFHDETVPMALSAVSVVGRPVEE